MQGLSKATWVESIYYYFLCSLCAFFIGIIFVRQTLYKIKQKSLNFENFSGHGPYMLAQSPAQ